MGKRLPCKCPFVHSRVTKYFVNVKFTFAVPSVWNTFPLVEKQPVPSHSLHLTLNVTFLERPYTHSNSVYSHVILYYSHLFSSFLEILTNYEEFICLFSPSVSIFFTMSSMKTVYPGRITQCLPHSRLNKYLVDK